jgi:tetratricopeptide (TPR) repeat protein
LNRQKILYALAGLLVGAAAGFLFANSANRRELEELRGEAARARSAAAAERSQPGAREQPGAQGDPAAAEGEVRQLIARADAAPSDANAQRRAAEGAYRHALSTGQSAFLADATRLFKRAYESDPSNYDTLLLLANSHLTLGLSSDPKNFLDARGYYLKALQARPGDVNVHTLLGMTYSYARPPDTESAIREYRKALAGDPRHEMALQNLASALISAGRREEAARRVEELAGAHPGNKSLEKLRAQLAQGGGAAGRAGSAAKDGGAAKERE